MILESVAVCLFGISFQENYNHWAFGKKRVDYRLSLSNYKEHLFSKLNHFDVYGSTYQHSLLDNLKKDLNIKQMYVEKQPPLPGLHHASKIQRNNMIAVFDDMLKKMSYEWYLFTRFDLMFHFNVDEFSIDANKINVLVELEKPWFVCDNFYLVHRLKLAEFFMYLKQQNISNRHDVNFFGGSQNLNTLLKEKGKCVNDLECYKIVGNPS